MSDVRDPEATTFADLALRSEVLDALTALGYEEPTPIQREAIPPLLEGRDLLGQAATGTGKTAAFALPIVQRLAEGERGPEPRVMVLVPTRELAMQVSEAIHKYGRGRGVRVLPIYGGQPIRQQLRALDRGVDVVVATPGRATDHIGRGTLDPALLDLVVLDEADEMLDMGFAEDLETILGGVPESCQTVLFSATMPPRIDAIARRSLTDPVRVVIGAEQVAAGEPPRVRQVAYIVPRASKPAALARVLDVEAPEAAIVFCRTRDEVDTLTETLNGRGHRAEALHGGMDQGQRDRVMGRLRSGSAELLIATDVAARGLDIDQLTHVVNYDVPSAPASYVHRIGRVGRAGREGVAVTLAEPREHRHIKTIQRVTGQKIAVEKVPTIADMRARRLELLRGSLESALAEDEHEEFRVVVEALASEHDVMEVAMAAIRLAHEATGADGAEEDEIPDVPMPWEREGKRRPRDGDGGGKDERPARGGRQRSEGMTRIFIGAGRAARVRPQDLVGAIANESGLSGRQIGAIEIADRFSLVEIPDQVVDDVITALRRSTIKGRKATVRRERF